MIDGIELSQVPPCKPISQDTADYLAKMPTLQTDLIQKSYKDCSALAGRAKRLEDLPKLIEEAQKQTTKKKVLAIVSCVLAALVIAALVGVGIFLCVTDPLTLPLINILVSVIYFSVCAGAGFLLSRAAYLFARKSFTSVSSLNHELEAGPKELEKIDALKKRYAGNYQEPMKKIIDELKLRIDEVDKVYKKEWEEHAAETEKYKKNEEELKRLHKAQDEVKNLWNWINPNPSNVIPLKNEEEKKGNFDGVD